MPDKFFVDANILLYAHDRWSGAKHERALVERLWSSGQSVLRTQVLRELCINLRRKVAARSRWKGYAGSSRST